MQHVENEFDITLDKLTQTTTKSDEKKKAYAMAEGEIQALKEKYIWCWLRNLFSVSKDLHA